jgi:hypothetical protein
MRATAVKTCLGCDKAFTAFASDVARGRGKYCSLACSVGSFVDTNTKHQPLSSGDKFHMLTLTEPVAKGRNPTWKAKCDCGKQIVTRASRFRGKRPLLSCGCYRKPRMGDPLAATRNSLYATWRGIIARTSNADDPIYGGRGISLCERWKTGDGQRTGFQCFLVDMGPKPSRAHSIDRYPDNDGNYEPSNCRWATPKEQARNRRQNIFVDVNGKKLCLLDAVPILNPSIDYETVLGRIDKGWPVDRAIHLVKMPGKPLRKRPITPAPDSQ